MIALASGPTLRLLALGLAAVPVFLSANSASGQENTPDSSRPSQSSGWATGRTPAIFRQNPDGLATRVGGWFDASYEDNDLSGATQSFNLNHANVYLDTRYGRKWQAFLEVEFEHEKALGGFDFEREYEVEQAYLRYQHSTALEVRAGNFNTPFGFWTPVHWSILMDTIQPPMHEGLRLIPEQQTGAELRGTLVSKIFANRDAEVRYSVYLGHGDDTALFDESGTRGPSYGGDVRLTVDEESFFGVSVYQQKRDLPMDRTERSLALYGQSALTNRLTLRGEYVHQDRDDATIAGLARSLDTAYAKLRWDATDVLYLNYRYNWGGDDSAGTTDRHHIHTLTLGIDAIPGARVKLELADHRFRDSLRDDFLYWGVSFGYSF